MGCGGSKEAPDEKAEGTETIDRNSAVDRGVSLSGPLSESDLKARIIGNDVAEEFKLGKTGFTLRYAAVSQRGYYPEDLYKANQDRFVVCPNFNKKEDQILLGVFDGHGVEGDGASEFCKRNIEKELTTQMTKDKFKFDFKRAYQQTFLSLDNQMHEAESFDDAYSGTTAITVFFKGDQIFVANIGDSRAILGERHGARVNAYSLSVDQTPYRRDERERVKACGARIMTMAMARGEAKYVEGWEDKIGQEGEDETAEPPRIFHKNSLQPGNAFTRSLGDSMSLRIGITAEAELLQKQIREQDQFVVIASDGVWEFLTNNSVCDSIMAFTDPVAAARAIVAQAYGLWLQYEVRTDDITIIIAYIDTEEGKAPRAASEEELKKHEAKESFMARRGTSDALDAGLSVTGSSGEMRPVRRGLSAEKQKAMGMASADEDQEWEMDQGEWKMTFVHKTESEIKRIRAALKGNFLFANLPPNQTKAIYDVMRKKKFTSGEVVIKQGDKGEEFYVLDQGELAVTITNQGTEVEIMRYRPNPAGANPCFGELALMYSKPRAATVTALTDGMLWAIDRRSFREIAKKSSSKYVMRTLRQVEVLKSLSVGQLQRLSERLSEKTFKPGEYVLRQGEEGDTFYIIAEGKAQVRKNLPDGGTRDIGEIFQGQYFGERALLKSEPRAANVIAAEDEVKSLRVLHISKAAFEEILGDLQTIIDNEATWRFQRALIKQLRKNAAGLSNAKIEDFHIHGVVITNPPVQCMLARHPRGKEYTIRAVSKKQVIELGFKARLREEMKLLTTLQGQKQYVPLALQTIEDDSYIYSVYPTRLSCTLSDMLQDSEGIFDEKTARFYTACIIVALEHLHTVEGQTTGGVIFRNLSPGGIAINEQGYPQLIDFRFATHAEPPPRDFCGYAHYLSPEQVSGQGHGLAVDLWALGVLMYECTTSANPWLTGDGTKDSEIAIYSRITSHKKGGLKFPDMEKPLSANLASLLNALMEPKQEARLGCKPGDKGGFMELRAHPWFEEVMWTDVSEGTVEPPHKKESEDFILACIKTNDNSRQSAVRDQYFAEVFEGDNVDFEGVATAIGKVGKSEHKSMVETIMDAARSKKRKGELAQKKADRERRLSRREKEKERKASLTAPKQPIVEDDETPAPGSAAPVKAKVTPPRASSADALFSAAEEEEEEPEEEPAASRKLSSAEVGDLWSRVSRVVSDKVSEAVDVVAGAPSTAADKNKGPLDA